jgi:hypothetical protein
MDEGKQIDNWSGAGRSTATLCQAEEIRKPDSLVSREAVPRRFLPIIPPITC